MAFTPASRAGRGVPQGLALSRGDLLVALRLNASIHPTGSIRVAVRKFGTGEDLPGRTFEDADRLLGDNPTMPVTWKGEDSLNHEGEGVILRFRMKQARLFGIEFY